MNTSEILNKAADLIERRGWGQGVSTWNLDSGDNSKLCLEGGILAALGVSVDASNGAGLHRLRACPAYHAVHSYLNLPNGIEAWEYNDDPGRTANEVIEVLRATTVIEAAREEAAETVNQPTEELAVTW